MRLKAGDIRAFMRAAKPPSAAVLIYGPDEGLVRERGEMLAKKIVSDLNDAFLVTDVSDADVRSEPSTLADAIGSMSLMGGERVVRLRPGTDGVSKHVEAALADLRPADETDVWLIIEAGDLTPRSSLRKLFETSKVHAALPCYVEEGAALEDLIRGLVKAEGCTLSSDAMPLLLERLGGDRGLVRREIEKLGLFAGPGAEVSADDVRTIVVGSDEAKLDGLVDAALSGDMRKADMELQKAFVSGAAAPQIIRMLTNQMKTLHLVAGLTDRSGNVSDAIKSLRPPVRWPRDKTLMRQANLWSRASAERALTLLERADADCKTSALPAEAICGRVVLSLTRQAAVARR